MEQREAKPRRCQGPFFCETRVSWCKTRKRKRASGYSQRGHVALGGGSTPPLLFLASPSPHGGERTRTGPARGRGKPTSRSFGSRAVLSGAGRTCVPGQGAGRSHSGASFPRRASQRGGWGVFQPASSWWNIPGARGISWRDISIGLAASGTSRRPLFGNHGVLTRRRSCCFSTAARPAKAHGLGGCPLAGWRQEVAKFRLGALVDAG